MAVKSIRLNEEEEKLIMFLKKHYNCDTSTLLKRSLWEMYEDIKDKEIIEDFENKEKSKKTKFFTFNELNK